MSGTNRLSSHRALIRNRAGAALGLDFDRANNLFTPDVEVTYENITPQQAVATLRGLAETGKVHWGEIQTPNNYDDSDDED